ncbi:MAG TPA: hypothetical protein VGK59_10135 [Ohtaekwangia sp.]
MKTQTKLYLSILGVALSTEILLLIPWLAMQFTDEVHWSPFDFLIAALLLFLTGLSFVLVTRFVSDIIYRAAVGLAFGTTLLMIWVNLAVGLIGSGPNLGNILLMIVVPIVVAGTIRSRMRTQGMERTMYVSALTVVLIAIISILMNTPESSVNSTIEIAGVCGLFAALFAVAGSLFRYAPLEQDREKSEG